MHSLKVFLRVVWALIKREARTRNGKMRFGYIWAFLEPAIYVAGLAAFRTLIGNRIPFGENALIYLLTAFLTFRTAMGLSRRTLGAIDANKALLTFPQVKTFDVIVARIALESATWVAITILFVIGLYAFLNVWAAQRLDDFISGYAATLFFGASFGFFNAVIVRFFRFWERILAMVSLPILFASGIFFLPSSLPPEVVQWLWWNPFLHAVEWVRTGVFLDYRSDILSPAYLLGLSLCLLFIGLFLNKFYQRLLVQD